MANPTSSYLSPLLHAQPHPGKGYCGVFAREFVPAGTLLALWTGDVVDAEQLEAVPPYLKPYSVQIEEGFYLLSRQREPADCINHACEPNAGLSGQVAVVAMRDIEPGEEICIDYAMCDGSPYDEFDCQCGAPMCRGRVTGNDWMLPELHARYAGYFAPYLQRRIDLLQAQAAWIPIPAVMAMS